MKKELAGLVIGGLFVLGDVAGAYAGPPLVNVEGVGGAALNPLAWVANPIGKDETGLGGCSVVGKPNIGAWHISLPDSDIKWDAAGFNLSFYNRIEIGYSHEWVDIDAVPGVIDKNNFSAKVNLVPEGAFDLPYMPAVSVGIIHKRTNFDTNGLWDKSSEDYYIVATKTITVLPIPMVLNAGILSTEGYVRGVLGFGDDRDEGFFGNIEFIPMENLIVGWEYQEGSEVDDDLGLNTHSLWEAHVAWMVNDLTLIAAYCHTGSENLSSPPPHVASAFGDGWVVSAQYAF